MGSKFAAIATRITGMVLIQYLVKQPSQQTGRIIQAQTMGMSQILKAMTNSTPDTIEYWTSEDSSVGYQLNYNKWVEIGDEKYLEKMLRYVR